jgi:hypothetical protein
MQWTIVRGWELLRCWKHGASMISKSEIRGCALTRAAVHAHQRRECVLSDELRDVRRHHVREYVYRPFSQNLDELNLTFISTDPGSTCCRAGAACGPDQGPCCGQGCCGVSQSCCAGGCCDPGRVCCSTGCCESGQHCCNGAGSERCCSSDAPCCGGVCCPSSRECCGDVCCDVGFFCKTRGECAARVTSVLTTATEKVVTVTASPDHAPTGLGGSLGWKIAGAAAVLVGL